MFIIARKIHTRFGLFRATNTIRTIFSLLFFTTTLRVRNKYYLDRAVRLVDCLTVYEWAQCLERIGSKYDGGYVVPINWRDVDALFSPGVGKNSDFELEFAKNSINCFLLDGSVKSPPIEHPNFNFEKRFLGTIDDDKNITFETWLNSSGVEGDNLFLSMDIEGSEYEVLSGVNDEIINRFKYITIELHEVHRLMDEKRGLEIINVLEKLTQTHKVVNLHGNNFTSLFRVGSLIMPKVVELTLIRNDQFDILKRSTMRSKSNRRNDKWYIELPIRIR